MSFTLASLALSGTTLPFLNKADSYASALLRCLPPMICTANLHKLLWLRLLILYVDVEGSIATFIQSQICSLPPPPPKREARCRLLSQSLPRVVAQLRLGRGCSSRLRIVVEFVVPFFSGVQKVRSFSQKIDFQRLF